jgi:hypothetical protein
VYGQSASTNGTGVSGVATATSGITSGVQGSSSSPNGSGVSGINTATGGAGVGGQATATSGYTSGVYGQSASTNGTGVTGNATATSGPTSGVYGQNASTNGNGVNGTATATSGYTNGVYGRSASSTGHGLYGYASATSGNNVGVVGFTESPSGTAGQFVAHAGAGLVLQGLSGNALMQIFTVDASGNGFFSGNLNVTGKLTKGSGSFKIDDPLDPAHKYLSHSFVESPDMMNVYNGNITTDKHGLATVVLPEYFEALNRDFRYQLTVIGQFAQAIVAKKISNNRFVVRTSKPGVEVSWQVTGIRHDAYADAYRIPVEEEKPPQEQGHYLHPELFGASEHEAIGAGMVVPSTRSAPSTRTSTMNLLTEDGDAVK